MKTFVAVTKALSDENRVRALMALRSGELCVCQIIELLGLAPSTVSKHMSILKQAGLALSRKEERWMYYRLPREKERSVMLASTFKCIFDALENDEIVRRDAAHLKKIIRQNPSQLCKSQREA